MPIATVSGRLDGVLEMTTAILNDAVIGAIAIKWINAPFAIEIRALNEKIADDAGDDCRVIG